MPNAEGVPLDRLPDDSVVVRGGLMLLTDLVLSAQSHFDTKGFYALSVYSTPGRAVDEIAVGVPLRHSKIRVSTVGRVRSAGYDVVTTQARAFVWRLAPRRMAKLVLGSMSSDSISVEEHLGLGSQ